jgi:hypothetical protein
VRCHRLEPPLEPQPERGIENQKVEQAKVNRRFRLPSSSSYQSLAMNHRSEKLPRDQPLLRSCHWQKSRICCKNRKPEARRSLVGFRERNRSAAEKRIIKKQFIK